MALGVRGQGTSGRRALLALALGAGLGWLGYGAAQLAAAAWADPEDPATLAILAARLPANVTYLQALARADLLAARPDAARRRLAEALERNPAAAGLWLDLADAALAADAPEEAVAAVQAARRRHPTSGEVCHRAAVVLLQVGRVGDGLAGLRCAADLAPERAADTYDLGWALLGDGALVREAIVPASHAAWRSYLHYARAHRPADVTAAWEGLERHGGAEPADRLSYVEFLAANGRGAEAERVWAAAYGARGANRVFNGSFESEPVGAGLDWVIERVEGVRAAIVTQAGAPDGRRVLEVVFQGAPVDFHHVRQVVPVEGGRRYGLRARVRTERLTGLGGPRLAVGGYHGCPLGWITGREWRGTTAWREETLSFVPPAGCSAVLVRLQRAPTGAFDRKIGGRLWLDRIEVTADAAAGGTTVGTAAGEAGTARAAAGG
jgi:hypothetical protein